MSFVRSYRRTIVVALAWVAVLAVLLRPTGAVGQTAPVEAGLGNAYAQGVKVDPRSGRLSFGITYGLALAGHQNQVARAEARSVDLGVIGTTLAAEACDGGAPTLPEEDQPQPLEISSTEDGSAEGKDDVENVTNRHVEASGQPYALARAVTTGAGQAGVVEVGSTVAETRSGIIDGVRQAIGTSETAYISLGGGAVVLKGLRWEAVHQSAPDEALRGSFTIQGLEIAGQSVPIPAGEALTSLEGANAVLNALGINLEVPEVRMAEGIVFVDPLRISVLPNDTRDGITGAILSALQPVRENVFDALIEADCSNASYITVLDIVLGSVTGAGYLNLEVGGVTATSSDIELFGGFGDVGGLLPDLPDLDVVDSSDLGSSSSFEPSPSVAVTSTTAPTTATSSTVPIVDETALPVSDDADGSRGGPLLAVGLAGLALLALLAEGDRRQMRKAQRELPMNAFG